MYLQEVNMPFKEWPELYFIWQSMRRRCLDPKAKQWKDYGGRGIKICSEWNSYHQFVKDMGPRPTPNHTMDRIDNDGNYTPSNCRWATRSEQQLNSRRTRMVSIEGIEYKAWKLAEKYGVKADTIVERAEKGFPFKACTTPGHLRWDNGRPKDACKNGHLYDEVNTKILSNGRRVCRECLRIGARKRYQDNLEISRKYNKEKAARYRDKDKPET